MSSWTPTTIFCDSTRFKNGIESIPIVVHKEPWIDAVSSALTFRSKQSPEIYAEVESISNIELRDRLLGVDIDIDFGVTTESIYVVVDIYTNIIVVKANIIGNIVVTNFGLKMFIRHFCPYQKQVGQSWFPPIRCCPVSIHLTYSSLSLLLC